MVGARGHRLVQRGAARRCRSACSCTSCSTAPGPTPTPSGGRCSAGRGPTPSSPSSAGARLNVVLEVVGALACWYAYRRFRLARARPAVPLRPDRSRRTRHRAVSAPVLIVVRHGRTEANASGLLLGRRLDPALDELGRAPGAPRSPTALPRRRAGDQQPAAAHPPDGGRLRSRRRDRRPLDRARLRRPRRHARCATCRPTCGRRGEPTRRCAPGGGESLVDLGDARAGRLRRPRRGGGPSATSSSSPTCRR